MRVSVIFFGVLSFFSSLVYGQGINDEELSMYLLILGAEKTEEKCHFLNNEKRSELQLSLKVIRINLLKIGIDKDRLVALEEKSKTINPGPDYFDCENNKAKSLVHTFHKVALNKAIDIATNANKLKQQGPAAGTP